MSEQNDEFRIFEWKDWLAGWIGGALGTVTGQPFDTIKVRMVNSTETRVSIANVTRKMIKNEGFSSLFKGTLSPAIGYGAMNGIAFAAYQISNRYFCSKYKYNGVENLPVRYIFISGFLSGCACDIITTPAELIKIQLQIRKDSKMSNMDVVKDIYKKGGIRGFYKGLISTLLRDGPAWAGYFGVYVWAKRKWINPEWSKTSMKYMAVVLNAGGLGGVFSWAINYPIDFIKTRIQATPFKPDPGWDAYKGFWDACQKTYIAEGGIRAFYKGFIPCIIRAYPVNAVIFFAYEYFFEKLKGLEEKFM